MIYEKGVSLMHQNDIARHAVVGPRRAIDAAPIRCTGQPRRAINPPNTVTALGVTRAAGAVAAGVALTASLGFGGATPAAAMAGGGGSSSSTPAASSASASHGDDSSEERPVLRFDDENDDVAVLQRALDDAGHPLPDTGWFGPMTQNAVKAYQAENGIPTTGVVAELTWGSLAENGHLGGSADGSDDSGSDDAGNTTTASGGGSSQNASGDAQAAIAFAEEQLGDSYGYGGTGPDTWDCSGLTQAALGAAGVDIPRMSQDQATGGQQVSQSDMQPGDLVIYYSGASHVGIYVGDGQIIHASRPGVPVEYASVDEMPIHSVVRYL
ncbi:hypothetical protein GCM10009702_07930 [Propioniferax innocua]